MKNLILLLSLVSFAAWAVVPVESALKAKIRNLITSVAGVEWSDKLLGKLPEPVKEMAVPEIPKNLKSSTDVTSYNKFKKPETEFDKLPAERKAQFDSSFIEELFQVTRKTDPKDEDLSTWMNNLQQGGSREAVYQALVLDDVYATLEQLDEKPSVRLIDFCQRYSKKFFNLNFSEDNLKSFNLYTLKRTLTEKGLDILEYYEGKDLELFYKWYAVYSADLAKDYSPLFKSDLRKNTDANFHYLWAKGMPLQHIKSEFILKTHAVMNQLELLQ
ncbi:MAG: hypothetical protein ACJ76H_01220 [Bacteriovoracaceae bacterium]